VPATKHRKTYRADRRVGKRGDYWIIGLLDYWIGGLVDWWIGGYYQSKALAEY
jgi:hypothetical protein